jgi:tol-pal system protein YbgF
MLLKNLPILSLIASAQTFDNRWGGGVALGTNSIYGDLKKTGYGFSGEGFLTWRLNPHLGITGSLGYGVLPFTASKFTINNNNIPSNTKASTNIVRGDLRLDYELASSKVRPYVGVGVSGFTYQVTAKVAGMPSFKSDWVNDLGFGVGGGLRFMVGPRMALDLSGNFRYTTGDYFDGSGNNSAKDAIIAITTGITFFGGSSGTDIYTEQAPVEESTSDDLSDFQQRVDQMDTVQQQQPQDMQEYVRLKSKMDELNQQIGQQEGEIGSLRTNLDTTRESVDVMQSQLNSTTFTPPSASFSQAYEEALSKFYGRRYNEAIADFNQLIQQFPDHSLTSNCVYWTGECYFGAGQYRDAVNAFTKVFSYPRSLKKDDALLMLGRSYVQLSQKEEAREAFSRLIREFPTSEFVAKAEQWMNKM